MLCVPDWALLSEMSWPLSPFFRLSWWCSWLNLCLEQILGCPRECCSWAEGSTSSWAECSVQACLKSWSLVGLSVGKASPRFLFFKEKIVAVTGVTADALLVWRVWLIQARQTEWRAASRGPRGGESRFSHDVDSKGTLRSFVFLTMQMISLAIHSMGALWHVEATQARKFLTTRVMLEQQIIYTGTQLNHVLISFCL